MQISKENPKDDNNGMLDFGSAFSSSFSKDPVKIDPTEYNDKLEAQIKTILIRRFPHSLSRQEIHPKPGRLNFACPYCGDSADNDWKKRGNVYIEGGYNYHCFNCGKHTDAEQFLKDFGQEATADESVFLREQKKAHAVQANSAPRLDPMFLIDPDSIEKWGIDRDELIMKMGLSEVRNHKILGYLHKRLQFNEKRFAWNQNAQKLFIFNLSRDEKKVIGMQIRNFKAQPKYLTFKLDKLYQELGMEIPEDESFESANEISICFNILHLNFNKPITVFEGPLDAFLYKNACAVCSSKNDFPIDIPVRWMYDYDKEGKKMSLTRLNQGVPVFLWKKYLSEANIPINTIRKVDLTDLLVFSVRKKLNLPSFEGYYSDSKYDAYWI